jgi:hypothetical protein
MWLRASRAAGHLTKLCGLFSGALRLGAGLTGKGLEGAAGIVAKHPIGTLTTGLTTAVVAPTASRGVRQAKAGLSPEYLQYSQNKGVPSLPQL